MSPVMIEQFRCAHKGVNTTRGGQYHTEYSREKQQKEGGHTMERYRIRTWKRRGDAGHSKTGGQIGMLKSMLPVYYEEEVRTGKESAVSTVP